MANVENVFFKILRFRWGVNFTHLTVLLHPFIDWLSVKIRNYGILDISRYASLLQYLSFYAETDTVIITRSLTFQGHNKVCDYCLRHFEPFNAFLKTKSSKKHFWSEAKALVLFDCFCFFFFLKGKGKSSEDAQDHHHVTRRSGIFTQ